MTVKKLLTEQNAKTIKGISKGYLTGILYMAPHTVASRVNLCPWSTPECREACLYSAGRGKFSNVQEARIKKALLFKDNRQLFFEILIKDINRLKRKAIRQGKKLAIRLNGTTDIPYENLKLKGHGKNIFDIFPEVQFYDYTKGIDRAYKALPKNYHLTLSYTGRNVYEISEAAKNTSNNIAIVFSDKLPKKYLDRKVLDGDRHDLRFLDDSNAIIGLIAKGDAKKMTKNKFIVNI